MAEFQIASATKGDMAKIAPLVAEMLAFHKTAVPAKDTEFATMLERDGPAGAGKYDCLIAWEAQEKDSLAVGFAMYSTVYDASFAGDGIFLRDIYVSEASRGKRVGKALMVHLAQLCLEQGYSRIDWHTDRLDLHARTFYELIAPDSFKLNRLSYRVEGKEIMDIAALTIKDR
ncbi:MAG: GNAT family N-acetyltransferase [Alphaproteobacteria bacterium]|nr:GNAT family N-acetyltransferase [Alphaproteobacteria bacterium]